jgi:putative transposase
MTQIETLHSEFLISLSWLSSALGVDRSTIYRHRWKRNPEESPADSAIVGPKRKPFRSLSEEEEKRVLEACHSARFEDKAPPEIYATLLDEGIYLGSVRTMYRILEKHQEVRERRAIVRHAHYAKPELLATAPNQVWSWDITKLLGPVKWTYYYLYVLLDIFSRYVVGWMLAERESGLFAKHLIAEACEKQQVKPEGLIIHSDRGSPMISKPVAQLMGDLGITRSLNRPHVSNDNPYSEAQFKTMKYCPAFPERFGSPQDGRAFCRTFFPWYNTEHRHGGIGYYTPESVHYGKAQAFFETRAQALNAAYAMHPERFVRKPPRPAQVPTEAWINPPKPESEDMPDDYILVV